ncbi:MAG TPA: HesA/MoeB/ThiF family protein [Hyphomonadaceae bacterium]|jgi:molybdopterin/thiamine biosynthesis adenylyltransferase|nr:HesA/MoeB/ThiF family protein [Hyphomonadaceae bacterium]
MSLTPLQLERYARHIMLRELGGVGQQKLLKAHVALVGLGALGGPAALYLAAAGVGKLSVIDDDAVSLSNLQRQVLFSTGEIGEPKTAAGAARLISINPDTQIIQKRARLSAANARELLTGADIVVDGSDSFTTRFDVNAACYDLGLPLVSGAVGRWSAQVSVFKAGLTRGKPIESRLPCYRCLVAEMPETEETCAAVGVAGPLTGMIGARLALEAIKEIAGAGTSLAGKLWLFDGLSGDSRQVGLHADPACVVCGG